MALFYDGMMSRKPRDRQRPIPDKFPTCRISEMDNGNDKKISVTNCAEALVWIDIAPLGARAKRDVRSAIETSCKWFGETPDSVPFDPIALRRLYKTVSPGGCGVTKKRFANVKSSVNHVLKLIGFTTPCQPLSKMWQEHLISIDKNYDRLLLTRFGRYCSQCGIEPTDVDDDTASAAT